MLSDISNIYNILNKSNVVRIKGVNINVELLVRRDYKYFIISEAYHKIKANDVVYTNYDSLMSQILEYYVDGKPTDMDFCDYIIFNDITRESMNAEMIESLLNVSVKVPKLIIITPFMETYAFPKFNSDNDVSYKIKNQVKHKILYNFKDFKTEGKSNFA